MRRPYKGWEMTRKAANAIPATDPTLDYLIAHGVLELLCDLRVA
jgi:hypothetical protein